VLLVASQNWRVEGESYFCTPGPSSLSRCAPTLGLADDGGDEAVALISHDGTLAFEVSRVTGQASRTLRIAPVDPAAIAARPTSADGCGPVRDAYRALARATACTSDSDCQAIPGIAIPGDGGGCTLFVNQTVSAAAVDAVKTQWSAGLCASGTSCLAPLGAVCRAGACGEACAGVALPSCETSCDNYNPDGICGWLTFDCAGSSEQCHPTCTNAALQRCTCKNNNTVVCEPRPLVDPTCPLPCRP
jgi:hypothetical protein